MKLLLISFPNENIFYYLNSFVKFKIPMETVKFHLLVSSYFTLLIWDLYFCVWYSNFTDLSLYLTDLTLYFIDLKLYLTDLLLRNF